MIYLDYQATTPLAPEAREAMLKHLDGPDGTGFGNPHSAHKLGRQAAAAIEAAREKVAALFPSGGQVIFTGGATEGLNTVLRGTNGDVLTFATEHSAVRDGKRPVQEEGRDFDILPVGSDGLADLGALETVANVNTGIVSAMAVNNEIGVKHPIGDIAAIARRQDALLLVDGVQAFGRIDLTNCPADFIAISAHKIHGPKGIGALWLREGAGFDPLTFGGGQEAGLRSGTLSPALIAGLGAAAALAGAHMEEDAAHVELLWNRAREHFGSWPLNGSAEHRWRGNMNIRKDGLDVGRLMSDCRNIMFSAGSACASGSGRPSHVLKAIGLSDAEAKSSIRLGWGRYTSLQEIDEAAAAIKAAVKEQEVWT
jgi:cysteine desulfurase